MTIIPPHAQARMTNPTSMVDSDNPALGRLLYDLINLVTSNGGHVHPGVRLRARDGQLGIHCGRSMCDADTSLFRLPRELLVPVDSIQWAARDDQLQAISGTEPLTPLQRDLLALHVDLYNASHKLPWAVGNLPALALRSHTPLLQALQAIRPGFGQETPQAARAFVRTRVFKLEGSRVLMPLIDFLNHHPKGGRFQLDAASMTMTVAQTGDDDECFAAYGGRRDVLDLALHYGYADKRTPFAFVAPLECAAPGLGRLRIAARKVQALHPLDPPQVAFDDTGVTLSHLTCDSRHPKRLHTTLRLALLGMARKQGLGTEKAEQALMPALEMICAANLGLLQQVQRAAEPLRSSVPVAAMLSEAVALQADILREVLLPTGRTTAFGL